MPYNLNFISYSDLIKHISHTIEQYGDKLQSFDLERFNKNIVDPVKLIFDKEVYRNNWETVIDTEISRQRDKSNNNDIGYFHQNIFRYIKNCEVPTTGWDVIYSSPDGINIEGKTVHTIYVEMKNKHNTMNSSSAQKTYIRMLNQLSKDQDCVCFLVEAIAKHSQNIRWETTVDGERVSNGLIRRVSMDKFYEIVTGEENAFYQLCCEIPIVIAEVVDSMDEFGMPNDTAYEELRAKAEKLHIQDEDLSFAMAVYMLGFSEYNGF